MNDIVTLPTLFFDRTGWTFTDLARQLGILSGSDPLRMLVQWQHDSLGTLDAALWVEPDLYSFWSSANTPQQAPAPYTPAEFEFRNSAVLSRLRLIKADLAYNFTGQGVSDRRPINVAVLDTGVDHKHPDLENQMWRNEGETPDNGNDDEGNGYKDDIHGIDATLGPGDDGGLQPRPGSADIGGPGVACPRPSIDNDDKLVDNCGHGTHVAGIIAAQHGADTQTLGICPNCRIMSVRVAERCVQPDTSKNKGDCVLPRSPLKDDQYEVDGNIADSAQIRALQYLFNTRNASNRGTLAVNIVNMSLGKYFRSRSMAYLLQKLQESNVAIVAAAGNDDTDTPSFPAAYEAVVAVCATSIQGSRGDYGKASFSNFGEWVDLCAPGEGIQSTMPGRSGNIGEVDTKQGTSQATPFVSGALGYLMSVSVVQQDVQQLIKVLKKAATSNLLYNDKANLIPGGTDSAYLACYKDRSSCDYLLGTGLLNLHKAVNPNAAGETFSEVDLNKKLAVSSGCVVSSVGHGRYAALNFWTSMPILLLQTLGAFAFCRRRFGRPSRMP
jgi:subtilisin family serine protease